MNNLSDLEEKLREDLFTPEAETVRIRGAAVWIKSIMPPMLLG